MELEKKLTELGNRVSTVVGDLSRVNDYFGPTDLFIFNLPNKIADDTNELMTLVNIANMVIASNARMIMVGEKELRPAFRWYSLLAWAQEKALRGLWSSNLTGISSNQPRGRIFCLFCRVSWVGDGEFT